jgi:hypothetical protein
MMDRLETKNLAYELTTRVVLLEKLTVIRMFMKSPFSYGPLRFP